MQNCPHCSTAMESYATICPGCGAKKNTEYSYYFNWLTNKFSLSRYN